jgi:hypothetical protein
MEILSLALMKECERAIPDLCGSDYVGVVSEDPLGWPLPSASVLHCTIFNRNRLSTCYKPLL